MFDKVFLAIVWIWLDFICRGMLDGDDLWRETNDIEFAYKYPEIEPKFYIWFGETIKNYENWRGSG